jgi:hypothetical protein
MGATTPARRQRSRAAWPYKFALVPLDDLFVDGEYQRPLTSFVNTVVRDYDPALLGTLIVSERRGGRMAIIDGQTRWAAMQERDEPAAPCLVYMNLTREDEARLFADLQTKRRGMATYLRFRAALVAKQPEATDIARIVQAAGFELDVEETGQTIKAIAALENVYRRGPDVLGEVMDIIARAWPEPDIEYRTSGEMIRGLSVFLGREQGIERGRLIERLSSVTPTVLRRRANALKEGSGSGGGSPGYMADAILGVYMSRRAASAAS